MSALPYALDVWLPLLRGGAPPVAVLDTDTATDTVASRIAALGQSERLAFYGQSPLGQLGGIATIEGLLPADVRIERFVIFPGTGGGFVLVPTADAACVRGGLPLLPSGRARWRAARLFLDALAPLGVVRRLGLTELIVVTRGGLRSISDALVADHEHFAIAAGVPDARQKLIARVLQPDGAPRALYKFGLNERSQTAIRDERRALDRLAELVPELAPRLLDRGERHGVAWFSVEVLEGHRSADVLTDLHIEFLHTLAQRTLGSVVVQEQHLLRQAESGLNTLREADDPEWHMDFAGLAELLGAESAALPTALAHGDFTPWNLAVSPHGLRAFDWEACTDGAPLLFDLFHFHIQTGVLVHRIDGARIFESLGEVLDRMARPLLHLGRLDGPGVLRALALYVLHAAVRDEVLNRAQPAPFVQVGWQRRARREIARRVAGCLRDRRVPWSSLPVFDAAA